MTRMNTAANGKRLVGKPVTVIRVNEQGKLTLNSEALQSVLLQKDVQNLPVVVLSVAGAIRTGKSSILNVLLRFPYLQFEDWLGEPDKPLEGFPWMPGSDPHTEGIVFWSNLFRATTADKKKVAVLLIDTQGSFGTSSSTAMSVHIFALSVLISSIQVFNVMRNLQLDHLQHLQMYYKYGKHAQDLESGTSDFQRCVFLVRDWQWPKDYEFGWEGGERLLQKILGTESKNKATDELRHLRTYFKSCLSSRKCFLMPSPGHTDDGCSLNGAVNGITQPFKKYLGEFVQGVLSPSKLVVKTVDGEPLTASQLCKFVEKITPMFSSKELPVPVSMAPQTAQFCAQLAREKALKTYRASVAEAFRSTEKLISPEELRQKEKSIRNEVLYSFDNAPRLKLYGYHKKARESLIKNFDAIFSKFRARHEADRKNDEEKEVRRKLDFFTSYFFSFLRSFFHYFLIRAVGRFGAVAKALLLATICIATAVIVEVFLARVLSLTAIGIGLATSFFCYLAFF
uniref:Putative guanylate-binding protein n=1 Tax=Ixodes ricinus TaxID=34613 RepID=A0A6B0VE21_IXORI